MNPEDVKTLGHYGVTVEGGKAIKIATNNRVMLDGAPTGDRQFTIDDTTAKIEVRTSQDEKDKVDVVCTNKDGSTNTIHVEKV